MRVATFRTLARKIGLRAASAARGETILDLTDLTERPCAATVKDYGSRELFVHILESEEEHIDWLQTQLRLIEQMGLQNFVQLQTKPNESGAS